MASSFVDAHSETGEIQSSLLSAKPIERASRVIREMSDEDVKLQAQEFIYRQTLRKEKSKVGRHALEEVGRSLNAISQRRRQYFLEYKNCNSIRCVRQWYAWETKRNLETNVIEARSENAATRGIRMFLHRVDFYGTLLARFVEYILRPLQTRFSTTQGANPELENVKDQMKQMKAACESLLSDNTEVVLDNVNHIEVEQRFPIISVLPRVHETLNKMVILAFQWRIHASFEQRFEQIDHRRSLTETERGLNEKRKTLRAMEHNIRRNKRSHELLEEEIGARMQAISTSNFSKVYAECTERLEAVREAYQQCKANLENAETAIKTVQQGFGKYKIVGQKQKKKLESSLVRRTRKVEELDKIKMELDRLENRKVRLDEEEVIWLRGGYENEVGVIESLKDQSDGLEKNLLALERQREDLKASYEQSMEQVLKLNTDFEELSHKYEYVKRLASTMIAELWSTTEPQVLVKPNKLDVQTVQIEQAYDMTQPKGVAMLVYNKWSKTAKTSPEKNKPKQPTTNDKKTDLGHNLESLFVQLGFYVIKRPGLSITAMRKNMAGLSDQYHGYSGNHNSLMVVFVANSNERGQIVGPGDNVVSVKEFLSHFSTSRCPTLMGKPKIFLFLLKVVSREPVLPMVDEILGKQGTAARKSTRLSADSDLPVYFEPEPLTPEDDFLVARVMFEDDTAADGGPTFGGVGSTSTESEMPWFARNLLSIIASQSGTTDLAEVMKNVKKSFRDHFASPRSEGSGDKGSSESSPFGSVGRLSQQRDDHVNVFVDSSLTRKLYLMPGL